MEKNCINYWFLKEVADKLQDLADTTTTAPEGMSLESWKTKLEYIVFLFREADMETCTKYAKELASADQLDESQLKEINTYLDACKTEALNLFNKYFWYLDE